MTTGVLGPEVGDNPMVERPRFDNVTDDLEGDVLVVAIGGEDQALVARSTWTGGGTAKTTALHRFTSFSNRAPGTAPCRSASRRTGSPTPPGRGVLPSEPDNGRIAEIICEAHAAVPS